MNQPTTPARSVLGDVEPRPGVAKPDPILVADGVQRRFGGLSAVDVEHLEVQRGTITALIGPNGAGKTTLFNLLTGFDRADAGEWAFDGTRIEKKFAYQVARTGMVRTFQLTKALPLMSVLDNITIAAGDQRGEHFLAALIAPLWRPQERRIAARAHELLDAIGMSDKADDLAGTLSGGQRKLLELARSIMAEPSLVMLDEPTAGVNPALTQTLLTHITDIRETGRTVLFVEHDMDVVMQISDWVVCMAEGRIIAEGPPRVIGADPAVIDAYLGRHHGEKHLGEKQ
ncbi:MAG: ABC transporter ATP-binding protein [Acidimicrobiia bacterium]|nr:ABC transporter ATP-binding protein [Acidimicrobiia bacterium]